MASSLQIAPEAAAQAYEALAPFYDDFTAAYPHEQWLEALERLALEHGASGDRVLDVACGTGKSARPLQLGGYEVTACDISPSMVHVARNRLSLGHERCFVADMRALPAIGPFDLAMCLDDSVNYLVGDGDLARALSSVGRTLRAGGLLIFDVNTIATYETVFATEFSRQGDFASYTWRGLAERPVQPGGLFAADVDVSRAGHPPTTSTHLQRHYPPSSVAQAVAAAGLVLLDCRGQATGASLTPRPNQRRDTKFVYVATRPEMEVNR